ncbi:hypothetical protein HMPREF1505_1406 [Prevotella sp. ICM33]|nr:hypothetical protein HMPREF1505_1406 [Prevotella sp. ICM33]
MISPFYPKATYSFVFSFMSTNPYLCFLLAKTKVQNSKFPSERIGK